MSVKQLLPHILLPCWLFKCVVVCVCVCVCVCVQPGICSLAQSWIAGTGYLGLQQFLATPNPPHPCSCLHPPLQPPNDWSSPCGKKTSPGSSHPQQTPQRLSVKERSTDPLVRTTSNSGWILKKNYKLLCRMQIVCPSKTKKECTENRNVFTIKAFQKKAMLWEIFCCFTRCIWFNV